MASALALMPSLLNVISLNFWTFSSGVSPPNKLTNESEIKLMKFPIPDSPSAAPSAPMPLPYATSACELFSTRPTSISHLANSATLSMMLGPPNRSFNLSNAPPTRLPIAPTTLPAPMAAIPAPTASIPKPTSIRLSPSMSSNDFNPSAMVGNALPIIQVAPATAPPINKIDAASPAAPSTTFGLANALMPAASPLNTPPIPLPIPLPSLPIPLPTAPKPPPAAFPAAPPAVLAPGPPPPNIPFILPNAPIPALAPPMVLFNITNAPTAIPIFPASVSNDPTIDSLAPSRSPVSRLNSPLNGAVIPTTKSLKLISASLIFCAPLPSLNHLPNSCRAGTTYSRSR